MKLSTPFSLASMLALAGAAAVGPVQPRLDVNLERVSHTGVKISITNNGDNNLRLLNQGSILDDDPTEKLHVYKGPQKARFHGMRKAVATRGDVDGILTDLKKGQTIEMEVNAAELHDLTSGGDFDIHSVGTIGYAREGEKQLSGVAQYVSNRISLSQVDGKSAGQVTRPDQLQKRADEASDCTGERDAAVDAALSSCSQLASQASRAALTNAQKVAEYFQDSGNSTRSVVSARLNAVAKECASQNSGAVDLYCKKDVGPGLGCKQNVIAYTYPDSNQAHTCDLFFQIPATPEDAGSCHQDTQSTTILHEFTHASGVYSPPTGDNGYGYDAATQLSRQQAIMNADSYALFADDIELGC